MDDRGLIYQGARDRLVARLKDAEHDVDKLLERVGAFAAAEAAPAQSAYEQVGRTFNGLMERLPAMEEALEDSAALDEEASTAILALREALEDARRRADFLDGSPVHTDLKNVRLDAHETVKLLTTARDAIREILLPYRVKSDLHGLSVGRSLDFKKAYEQQIPSADERKALLEQFTRRRDYFDEGVVDVAGELIWRKSSNRVWRMVTAYAFPPLFTVLVGAALCLPGLFGLEWSGLDETSDVLLAYLLVWAGVVAHLLVENVKQAQSRTSGITAIGEATDWLHLRWVGLAWSFFPIVVVVIGLLAIGIDVREDEEALMFFFGGYSVDSVAGVFLTRFGTAAEGGVTAVTAAVGGNAT